MKNLGKQSATTLTTMTTLVLLALVGGACSQPANAPADGTLPQAEASAIVTASAEPVAAAATDAGTPPPATIMIPTETVPALPSATETAAVADLATTEPSVEASPMPTEAVAINGEFEGTYFRGSEVAPVTVIDYSDFL